MFRARPKLQCLNSGKTAFLSKGPSPSPSSLLSLLHTTTNQPTNQPLLPPLPPSPHTLSCKAAVEFHDLGVSAIVLQGGGAELFEVGGTAVAVGVIVLVHVEGSSLSLLGQGSAACHGADHRNLQCGVWSRSSFSPRTGSTSVSRSRTSNSFVFLGEV